MKIKILTIFLFSLISSVNFAQNSLSFDFAETFHNKIESGAIHYPKITIDSIGNHCVTGSFHGSQDMDPSANEILLETANGGEEKIFLAKYTASGQLIWAKSALSSTSNSIEEIHTDGLGNVYISGLIADSIHLDFNGNQTFHSIGQHTNFIAKYTSAGSLLWYKIFQGESFHFNLSAANEIIAACTYENTIDIGFSGNPFIVNGSGYNILLTKFANDGTVLWAKSNPATASSFALSVGGIGSDTNNNILITGVFNGILDCDFDTGTHILNTNYGTSSSFIGIYFCKYSSSGSFIWGEMSEGEGWAMLHSFQVTKSGEFAIMGTFEYDRDFDVTSGIKELTGSASNDYFLAKYSPDCEIVYANKLSTYYSQQFIGALVLSENGNCNTYSRIGYNAYTENDTVTTSGSGFANKSDLVRWEFDSVGEVAQVHFFDVAPNVYSNRSAYGYAIGIGLDGNVVIFGEASKFIDLDQDSGVVSPELSNNYFLASFYESGSLDWASFIGVNSGGSSGWNESASEMVFNDQGAYAVTGNYRQQVDLDLKSTTHYSTVEDENFWVSYVSYYDSGNELLWSYCFTGDTLMSSIRSKPMIDSENNVLISLYYSGNLSFNTPLNNYYDTTNQGTKQVLFKFDSNGGLIWAKEIYQEFAASTQITDIELSVTNEIFVTGTYTGTLHFNFQGSDTTISSLASSSDIFIARYNSNGDLIWFRSLGSSANKQSFRILPDGNNAFYLSGNYSGTVNFNLNGGTNTYTSPSTKSLFFAKYSNAGVLSFVKSLSSSYLSAINDFKKDHSGNLILAGKFDGTLDCDPSSTTYNLTSNDDNSFIVKYTGSGQFIWAKSFESESNNEITSFTIDSLNNILAGGNFNGEAQFSSSPVLHRTSTGGTDIFLVYISENGQINNVFSLGAQTSEYLSTVMYRNGTIGISGKISELPVDFDLSVSESMVRSYSGDDGFIATYHLCTAPSVSIIWNFITMTASVAGVGYQWIDATTNEAIPVADQQSYTPTEDGSYYVVISTAEGCTGSSQILDIVNLGLEEVKKGTITIYPNPISSLVTVQVEDFSDSYHVSVYSLSGTMVADQNLSGNSTYNLDASAWPQGVYFIRLDSDSESQVFKVVKN